MHLRAERRAITTVGVDVIVDAAVRASTVQHVPELSTALCDGRAPAAFEAALSG